MRRLLFTLSALLLTGAAAACSCPVPERAGFIHASLKHLPANARGALFLAPGGMPPVDADDFVITSDAAPDRLPAALSYPDVGAAHRLRGQQLVRIGPARGFTPGTRYTIRYTGEAHNWRHAANIEFLIDPAPLAPGALHYQIVPEGPPQRRLQLMGDGRGSCSSHQPVIAQEFRYVLPAALLPYRQAVMFFSEERKGEKYIDRNFPATGCDDPFAETAYGDERDLIQADCSAPRGVHSVRGQAGFLEVEDHLQTTAAFTTDFGRAAGRACHGMGMLKEALQRGERERALDLVCRLPHERSYWGPFRPGVAGKRVPESAPPSSEQLAQLAAHATSEQRACIGEIGHKAIMTAPSK